MKLFLPQTQLEEWALSEQADLKDGALVVAGDPRPYALTPAVHFTHLVSGTDDQKLVARVKTEAQLEQLGAEQMADSVLLGETAYEVVPGYLADVPAGATEGEKPRSDGELLAAFLRDKMK